LSDFNIKVIFIFTKVVPKTLLDDDNPNYIGEYGPFPGEGNKKLYLDGGAYYWDEHIELAHW